MRKPFSILFLCMLLGIGASVVVQAEDLSDTPYDESESLPYEMTPSLSADLVHEAASALQVVPIGLNDASLTPRHLLSRAECSGSAACHILDSLVLLDCTLRC